MASEPVHRVIIMEKNGPEVILTTLAKNHIPATIVEDFEKAYAAIDLILWRCRMRCPDCHTEYQAEDLYCRQCGADLTTSTSLVPVQKSLPALAYTTHMPRGVAASVGAVAVGVGLELLRRSLMTRLSRPPRAVENALPTMTGIKDILLPSNDKPVKRPKGYIVEETVVHIHRVIRRS